MKDYKFDLIFSSDLKRAIRTENEIEKFHENKVIMTSEIREMSKGIFEGKPSSKLKKAFEESKKNFNSFKNEGGETFIKFKHRIISFFKNLKEECNNKTVLVISQGGVIRTFLNQMMQENQSSRKYQPDNSSLTIINWYEKFEIKLFNSTTHLK